jgi:glucose-1-phosphate thymidylyltransferase
MKIIIPMAGLGTRMRPHTLVTPKPLLFIAGKTIIERIIEFIKDSIGAELNEIHYVIGNFGKETEKKLIDIAIKKGAKGFIHYQDYALGTAHAISCVGNALNGELIVVFADTMFVGSIRIEKDDEAIIWTSEVENPENYGVVIEDDKQFIIAFLEKPKEKISKKAIIGIYYFKDGKKLKSAIDDLILEKRNVKGEYQLTDALQDLYYKGMKFKCKIIDKWLDCGNKDDFLRSTESILSLESKKWNNISKGNTIYEPVFIGKNCNIANSVIGPFVSIEEQTIIKDSKIEKTNIGSETMITSSDLKNSLIGSHAKLNKAKGILNVGDYSEYEGN